MTLSSIFNKFDTCLILSKPTIILALGIIFFKHKITKLAISILISFAKL